MSLQDLSASDLEFTHASTAVAWIQARYPLAFMLRDICGGKIIYVWESHAAFHANRPHAARATFVEE